MHDIAISNITVGMGHPPLVIAEMSGNHNQSLERALAIVDAAADAGAHALKLQTYTADTMTLDSREQGFVISNPQSLWNGRSLYDLYQEAHTPWEWHEAIFSRGKEKGMLVFSTPFDATSVDFLQRLDAPCYKVASFESTDTALIRKIASTGKPVIISTGMATLAELDETVRTAKEAGAKDIILLKCTSSYPATPAHTNIRTIPHMRELFDVQVGLSDHTLGIGTAVASVAFGATVIEKHFTVNRAEGGVDSAFSLEPGEFKALVQETKRAWESLGTVYYGPMPGKEEQERKNRRSLYITQDLSAGEILTGQNVRAIRPGRGLPCKFLELVLGKRITRDVKRGTPLSWDILLS